MACMALIEPSAAPTRRVRWVAMAAVFMLAAGVYANTLGYGPAWDAELFVHGSGATGGLAALPDLLTSPLLLEWEPERSPYRPVTSVSYALDWTLSGGSWSFLHWSNVLLHAAVTALVFELALRMGAPFAAALLAALLFGVHPVHVDAVANLAGRGDLLAALFVVSAVVVFLGPAAPGAQGGCVRAGPSGRGPARQVAVLVLYALAMGAKEPGMLLPALLLLAMEFRRPRSAVSHARELREQWLFWVMFPFLAAGHLIARFGVRGAVASTDIAPYIAGLPSTTRITTGIANWAEYLRLLVYPSDLAVDYGPGIIVAATAADLRFWAGLGVGIAAIALVSYTWRSRPLVAMGTAWCAVCLVPTSNLLFPIAQWVAERFLYLPSVGFAIAVAGAATLLLERGSARRWALVGLAIAVLAPMTVRSWARNPAWRDSETMVWTLLREHPESFRAQWILARGFWHAGRWDEALEAADAAIEANPYMTKMQTQRKIWLRKRAAGQKRQRGAAGR